METENHGSNLTSDEGSEPEAIRFHFLGGAGEYFRIWIVNLALSIVTLGVYSAWAKVRTQRYFYGNTRLDGSSFQYLASPIAILKGRIIAVVVFSIYWVTVKFYPVATLVIAVPIAVAFPWVVARALDFRARNSAFRNITFRYDGRYWQLLWAYGGLPLLAFTLVLSQIMLGGINLPEILSSAGQGQPVQVGKIGAFFPLSLMALFLLLGPYFFYLQKRYLFGERRFGETRFSFDARPRQFYWTLIFIAVFVIVVFVAAALLNGLVSLLFRNNLAVIPYVAIVAMLLAYVFVGAMFNTIIRNLVVNAVEVGSARMVSSLRVGEVFALYASNLVAIACSLGLLIPWAKVRMLRYQLANTQVKLSGPAEGFRGRRDGRAANATGEEVAEIFDVDLSI